MLLYISLTLALISFTIIHSYLLYQKIKSDPSYFMSRKFFIICAELGNTFNFTVALIILLISSNLYHISEFITGIGFASINLVLDLVVIHLSVFN